MVVDAHNFLLKIEGGGHLYSWVKPGQVATLLRVNVPPIILLLTDCRVIPALSGTLSFHQCAMYF